MCFGNTEISIYAANAAQWEVIMKKTKNFVRIWSLLLAMMMLFALVSCDASKGDAMEGADGMHSNGNSGIAGLPGSKDEIIYGDAIEFIESLHWPL